MELTADNIAAEVSGMTPCIMVVEDDDSTRATLKEALKPLGRVVDFGNPQDALSYLDGHGCVDAIITDMMMKEMHGVEFCTQVRERFNRDFLPILIYSSFNDPQLEKLTFDAGANDFIEKPINFFRLQMRIQVHLQNKSLYDQLQETAQRDGLNQLFNRHAFLEHAAAEFKRATRMGYCMGLYLFDIDHFKHYNDTYGHLAGDKVIKLVAKTLKASYAREGEVIGRFAGDEFIALSTSPTPASVDAHTSKLAKAVEDIHIELDGVKTRITLSIGVAILDMSTTKSANNVEPLETIKQLIEQADEQMYISKRNGRDQIHSQLIDQQLVQQSIGAA